MIKNYLNTAWRQLQKNKLYATINVLGLAVGLAVFLFSSLLVTYERTHDAFFANANRIYTAGTIFGPTADVGVGETDSIYTAFAPLIEADIDDVEEIARTVGREYLISIEDDHYYQHVIFADPALLKIFDYRYIEGSATALDDPSGVMITRSTASKFFGEGPALGKAFTLDHDVSLHVSAVIEDLPPNSHFVSSLLQDGGFDVIAPLAALNRAADWDLAGNFNNLSMGNFTYMLLPEDKDTEWLQANLDGVYERHFPEDSREFVTSMRARPLMEANTSIWDAIGLPVLDSIRILGFLVLIVAIVNYTNLATAQSLGRAREIGLRKTMGAKQGQLITQFLVESLLVAVVAMTVALLLIEVSLPVFNTSLDRGLALDYADTLPWLLATTLGVGVVAGAYPAWLITRASPIDALRDGGAKGIKGSRFRKIMLVLQFSISIFMLGMVLVMYLQNEKIEESSHMYPRSEIVTLQRLQVEGISSRLETLRNELVNLPGVESVSYSSLLPYLQSNSRMGATPESGDEASAIMLTQIIVDEQFVPTYDIPLIAGRNLTREIGNDTVRDEVRPANVIINELAVSQLGFRSPAQAIGQVFYDFRRDEPSHHEYTVVGVMPDQNFQGFHNKIKPTVFYTYPAVYSFGSVRVRGAEMAATLTAIEDVWDELVQDYPIQTEFLDDTFAETFEIFQAMTLVLTSFAFVALALSLIGLFGLAAFMAETRTKEIGVRKVMGASQWQIARLLIWQFSRPVIWALLFATPLAWFAANTYLQFFAERIALIEGIIVLAGLVAIVFAWAIVGVHAVRIARANPIRALRYE